MSRSPVWRGRPQFEVSFAESAVRAYEDGPGTQLQGPAAARFAAWVQTLPGGATLLRTVPDSGPFERLIAQARERDDAFVPPLYRTWFHVSVAPEEDARIDALAETLRGWPEVRGASVLRVSESGPGWVNPRGERIFQVGGQLSYGQAQLAPATPSEEASFAGVPLWLGCAGVDALAGWRMPGGDGSGSVLAIVDNGWNPGHTDLPPATTLPGGITNLPLPAFAEDRAHGTASVVTAAGIVNDPAWGWNRTGAVGCAPATAAVKFASVVASLGQGANPTVTYRHVQAIADAADALPPFGVLLLETQTRDFLAIEVKSSQVRETIQLAADAGRVVVEAAGTNGGSADQPALLWPIGQDGLVFDSGAIVVSARQAFSGNWYRASPYGERVDCHAWGDHVTTSGAMDSAYNPPHPTPDPSFGGSSGAAALVAGLALQIQGIRRAHGLAEFDSWKMREVFRNADLGTASADGASYAIGPMPDLRKIVDAHVLAGPLEALPDLVARQSSGDGGGRYLLGDLGGSPDIWIDSGGALADRWRTAGRRAEVVGAAAPGTRVSVRLRNRGRGTAQSVRLNLYSAPLSPLPPPDTWTLVGTAGPATVAPDGALLAEFPTDGSPKTYVVTWSWAGVAAPTPAEIRDTGGLEWFARALGKVAWRSFSGLAVQLARPDVADRLGGGTAPVAEASSAAVLFTAAVRVPVRGGCPWATSFRFEGPGLAGAKVQVTLPVAAFGVAKSGNTGRRSPGSRRDRDVRTIDLSVRRGRATSPALERLPPAARDRVFTLEVRITAPAARKPGTETRIVVLRQFLGGRPVARLDLDLDGLPSEPIPLARAVRARAPRRAPRTPR